MTTPTFTRGAGQPRPRLRRRDGDDALREGHLPQPLVRRAEPDAAGPRRRGAPGLRPRRRRRHRDEHLRRQSREARRRSASATASRRSTRRGRRSPGTRRASRPSSPARSVRSASASSRGARPASTKRRSTSASRWPACSKAASISSCSRRSTTSTRSPRRSAPCAACPTCRSSRRSRPRRTATRSTARRRRRSCRSSKRSAPRSIGVNCSVGPAGMLETIERMARVAHVPLSAQPNAGRPREIEGRNIYLSSPEYMASYARRFINNGVRLVGGCCGTTPEHMRHIKSAVRALSHAAAAAVPGAARTHRARTAGGRRRRTGRADGEVAAGQRARARQFVVSVELLPPRGHDAEALVEQARQLRIHGVDFVNIPDGPRASARMSALAASLVVQQQAGIETILHYACRDRNLLGMQSDLLGAHSMGVRNLLIITGDPPRVGDYPDATAVYDVDSIGLTNVVARLNRGLDIGGQPIGQPTAFHIGVALNPGALDPRRRSCGGSNTRSRRARSSRSRSRCSTRPAFARVPAADRRRAAFRSSPAIMPLESLRHAEFMANEVPGRARPGRRRRAHAPGRERRPGRGGRDSDCARDRVGDPSAGAGAADFDGGRSGRGGPAGDERRSGSDLTACVSACPSVRARGIVANCCIITIYRSSHWQAALTGPCRPARRTAGE